MVEKDPTFLATIYDLAKDWQTLIAAIIASATAFFSLRPSVQQYNEQRRIEIERAKSKANQARAMMADNLSAIARYTEQVHDVLRDPNTNSQPPPPDEVMKELRELMIDIDEAASERVRGLSYEYQVHNARLRDFLFNRGRGNREIIGAEMKEKLYDLAVLRATADSLYDYSRKRTDHGPKEPITAQNVDSGLSAAARGLPHFDRDDDFYSGVLELIEEKQEAEEGNSQAAANN